jgi:cell division protein FtsB
MKIAGAIALSVILIFLGIKVFGFVAQERDLSKNLADIQTRLTKAQNDEADLEAESKYLANPLNLEKELRARFNYKKPGEKMIIIVPSQATGTTSTAQ